jgi:Flp pilus assembly protein CpaB
VGFRLASDLAAGSPLHFADVLREQVIALQDLPGGATVPADAVASHWSVYRPDALVDLRQVIGRRILLSIRKGEILTRDQLSTGASSIRAR